MLIGTIIVILMGGGAVAFLLHGRFIRTYKRITLVEYSICAVALTVGFVPLVGWAGGAIAQGNAVGGYQEFWGGSLMIPTSEDISCERDGRCVHTYDCDPYQVLEHYTETVWYWTTESYTDANGKTGTRPVQRSREVPKTRWVTKYHSCPYATSEHSFWLTDSFGKKHTIASRIFAANAQVWRRGRSLPKNVAQGVPEEWRAAKAGIDSGDAPPATRKNEYTNFLLASQNSVLAAYSDSIEEYRAAGLLPYHTLNLTKNPVYGGYKADKMVFAGIDRGQVGNYDEWQQSLGRLNSYAGVKKQADVHVLAVPASRIKDPEDYTNAMLAYWQSRELGKLGLAKNAIMLVVGVSDDLHSIKWARAKTGIPEGNSGMLEALALRLPGVPFEPRKLLGWPTARVSGDKLEFTPSDGAVENVIMRDYPFKRPCMEHCDDKGDTGTGYVYLRASAYISTGAQLGIAGVLLLVGMIVFAAAALWDFTKIPQALHRVLNHALRRLSGRPTDS
jgi:hypothetical protein